MEETYIGVKHPGRQEDAGNVDDVVAATANTGSQRPKTNRGRLSDDDPGSGRRAESEQHGDDETERCLCERSSCLCGLAVDRHSSGHTKHNQQESVDSRTPDVDGSAAKVGGENPGEHDEDSLQSGSDQTQGESGGVLNASLCDCVSFCIDGFLLGRSTYV